MGVTSAVSFAHDGSRFFVSFSKAFTNKRGAEITSCPSGAARCLLNEFVLIIILTFDTISHAERLCVRVSRLPMNGKHPRPPCAFYALKKNTSWLVCAGALAVSVSSSSSYECKRDNKTDTSGSTDASVDTDTKYRNHYRSHEASMKKFAGCPAPCGGVPGEPVYLLDVALHPAGDALAASCSDLALRLRDRVTLRPVSEYRGHSGRVCGVTFARARPNLLYSASEDGTVRAWDVRRPGAAAQLFRGDPTHSFCSFDLSCDDSLLCAGTWLDDEDSLLVFWDSRKPDAAPLGAYSESHSDDITQVRFHPRDKDRLASGSTDGLVNVFDLRRGSEEEALLCTCNGDSSVASVCWAAADGSRLLCLSHDERLRLWDLRQLDTERPLTVFSCPDVRGLEPMPGGRGLDYLVGGAWLEAAGKLLVVGGDKAGDVRLMECDGDGLRLLAGLRGGHAATVRCFVWDEAQEALVTGGEDARLLLWKPGREEDDDNSSGLELKWKPREKVQIHK